MPSTIKHFSESAEGSFFGTFESSEMTLPGGHAKCGVWMVDVVAKFAQVKEFTSNYGE